jgi:hypothetical protein
LITGSKESSFFNEGDVCAGYGAVQQFSKNLHFSMRVMFVLDTELSSSSDKLFLKIVYRQQSIHLREKSIAGPTERSAMHMHC